jgi:hypothetical protein
MACSDQCLHFACAFFCCTCALQQRLVGETLHSHLNSWVGVERALSCCGLGGTSTHVCLYVSVLPLGVTLFHTLGALRGHKSTQCQGAAILTERCVVCLIGFAGAHI